MFTPIHTSLGALLLFQGSSGLLVHNGAVFGISSLLSGSVVNPSQENVPIIAGLISSVIPISLLAPSLIPEYPAAPSGLASAAATLGIGLLLGWGTKNGCGCTSGHMLCGLSRLSPRSFISTALFFTTALITASVVGGGSRIPACGDLPCYTAVYPSSAEMVFMAGSLILSTILNFIVVPKTLERKEEHRTLFAYLAGLEFGLGLWISGMADSAKVLRFFAIATDVSRWDPSLALIILFGIGPSLVTFLAKQPGQKSDKDHEPSQPTLAEKWRLPTKTLADIDWRFVVGSIAFGVAWGLQGVCPGPALLRSVVQPTWGLLTMAGYAIGNLF